MIRNAVEVSLIISKPEVIVNIVMLIRSHVSDNKQCQSRLQKQIGYLLHMLLNNLCLRTILNKDNQGRNKTQQ